MERPSPSQPSLTPSLSRRAGEGLTEMARFLPLARIAGEGGERSEPGEGLGAERRENRFEHAFGVGEDVVVPEANDTPALAGEPFGPPFIGNVLGMLAAVRFDDEPVLGAGEVNDEGADRMLSSEAIAAEASCAQVSPETDLGVRRCASEVAGEVRRHDRHHSADTAEGRICGGTLTRLASLATLSRGEAVNFSRLRPAGVLREMAGCDSLILGLEEQR